MSELFIGVVAALAGALFTLFVTWYARLRDSFKARVGAFQVVQADLKAAHKRIDQSLQLGTLWPSGACLTPRSWDESRSLLASQLTQKTWTELQQLVADLNAVDEQLGEARPQDGKVDSGLRSTLEKLQPRLRPAVAKLHDALVGARRLPVLVGSLMGAAVIGLVVAVIIALVASAPAWTSESVANTVRTILPGARSSICAANTQLEGAYTCTVGLPACAMQTATGQVGTRCSPPTEDTYSVETEKSCYAAALTGEVINGDPPPFIEWLRRFGVRWGCKKP